MTYKSTQLSRTIINRIAASFGDLDLFWFSTFVLWANHLSPVKGCLSFKMIVLSQIFSSFHSLSPILIGINRIIGVAAGVGNNAPQLVI